MRRRDRNARSVRPRIRPCTPSPAVSMAVWPHKGSPHPHRRDRRPQLGKRQGQAPPPKKGPPRHIATAGASVLGALGRHAFLGIGGEARIPGIIVGASVPGAPFHRHNRTLTVMHLAVKEHTIFVSHCISSKYKNKMSLECSISRSQGTHQILVDQSQNSPEVVGTNYEKPLSVYSERGLEWCHQEMSSISKWLYIFALKNRNKRNLPLLLHLISTPFCSVSQSRVPTLMQR